MEKVPVRPEATLEKKEQKEYDPVAVMREREIMPEVFGTDKRGRRTIEDRDLRYITDYLREHIKPGSVLNLGGGFMHCHRILPAIDKVTSVVSVDISEKNNEIVREFVEGSVGMGEQKFIDASDVELLRTYAEALVQSPRYKVRHTASELLSMLHEKHQRNGKPDVITADIIGQMEEIGSGELLEGRTFDNVLFLWSIFTRDREETLRLVRAAKQRLNPGGRIVVMDVWDYSGVEENGNAMHSEDELVARQYPTPWIWSTEDFIGILKEAGFSKVRTEEKPVEESDEEEEAIGGYICFVAEE